MAVLRARPSMRVEVVQLPKDLRAEHLRDRAVVVFDVLRATTSMVAALANGAQRIIAFESLAAARDAAALAGDSHSILLCGEANCLRPAGFDLGNSPGGFARHVVQGKTIFMSTTNGTRAILAARGARALVAAAIVNATATARRLAQMHCDITLLCAGTEGQVAAEDLIGAGAVIDALAVRGQADVSDDITRAAHQRFRGSRPDLPAALRDTVGGQNIIRAGLSPDIAFAARQDIFDVVAHVSAESPPVVAIHQAG